MQFRLKNDSQLYPAALIYGIYVSPSWEKAMYEGNCSRSGRGLCEGKDASRGHAGFSRKT